jgi:uncharacterized lipoprotein YajG
LLLAALACLGCLGPELRLVQLRPAVPAGLVPVVGAGDLGVRVQVQDQRPLFERTYVENLNKVANDTNPLGESRYPNFISDRSLEAVFREAFLAALVASGFREGREGDLTLTLTLTHFFGEIRHYTFIRDRVEAGLELTVLLEDGAGHARFSGPVKAQVLWKPIQDDTLAVQATMTRLVESGVAALLQEPAFRAALVRAPTGPAPGPPGRQQP